MDLETITNSGIYLAKEEVTKSRETAHDLNNILTYFMGNIGLLSDSVSDKDKQTIMDIIQVAAEQTSIILNPSTKEGAYDFFELIEQNKKAGYELDVLLEAAYSRLNVVKNQIEGEKGSEFLDDLCSNYNRCKELIDNLKGLTQFKEGRWNINNLVNEVGKVIGASGKNVEISCNSLQLVYGKESYLYRIILNLATNARDAVGEEGYVKLITEDVILDRDCEGLPAGQYIRLIVEDDGTGITEEMIKEMWKPGITSKEGEGHGHGMHIIQEYVNELDAKVTIETEVEKGTRFSVYFPAVARKILIIDDEEHIRKMLYKSLGMMGYDVFGAKDAEEAKGYIGMDLIVTDSLPSEHLKEVQTNNPTAEFYFMSGETRGKKEWQMKEFNSKVFLQKPFETQRIKEHLIEDMLYS